MSKRTDLKAPQLYELGVIYARTVSNRERATALWQRAQKLDPDYARSVGLDKLLTP